MEPAAGRGRNHGLVTIEQGGDVAAFLASEAAAGMTGNVVYVDNGYNVVG